MSDDYAARLDAKIRAKWKPERSVYSGGAHWDENPLDQYICPVPRCPRATDRGSYDEIEAHIKAEHQ